MSESPAHVSKRAVGRRVGFFGAALYPLRGARFVYRDHPGLARYWLPPVLLTCCALIATTWFAIDVHADLVEKLWAMPEGAGAGAVAERGLHRVLEWLVAFALIAAGFVAVALSTSVIAAPFNDALSEAVERAYAGRPAERFQLARVLRDVGRTIGLELTKLLLYCSVMGPAFLLSWLVPGVGAVLYAGLGFVVTALFLAIDYSDFAAARRGLSVGDRLRDARRRAPAMLGLGVTTWALLFAPLLNVLFMPAAVAGATLLFLDTHPGDGPAAE